MFSEKAPKVTRAELYRRIWSTPMSTLAKEFGLSDVGLQALPISTLLTLDIYERYRHAFATNRSLKYCWRIIVRNVSGPNCTTRQAVQCNLRRSWCYFERRKSMALGS